LVPAFPAKTPAGASLDGQCDLRKQKVQQVQKKDAWPTRRMQARRGFLHFLHFLRHKTGLHHHGLDCSRRMDRAGRYSSDVLGRHWNH